MCAWFGWNKEQIKVAWEALQKAMVLQFGALYGWDVNNLASWQLLCCVLRINPIPRDLVKCRQVSIANLSCRLASTVYHAFTVHTAEGLLNACEYLRPSLIPDPRVPSNLPFRNCAERIHSGDEQDLQACFCTGPQSPVVSIAAYLPPEKAWEGTRMMWRSARIRIAAVCPR